MSTKHPAAPGPLRSHEEAQTKTLASILTESIRQDIIAGVFLPQSKLKVRELSERYGAGAIPLREALSRLVMSGFVEAEDQKGFRVAGISEAELLDITRIRQWIESEALRDSILHGDLDWESNLLSASHRLSHLALRNPENGEINPQWDHAHDALHSALISACTSPWLIKLSGLLREQTGRYRHISIQAESAKARDLQTEHKEIVNAALERDADRACALLAEHFALTSQLVLAQQHSKQLARTA
ncbi:FCD domain-containing protein [Pseudogulbenkiania subflava]|uniref:DNA-binding transcriptional regulator, GntR family n=1 Tax=Pseudogulbenkiania subflava DSM 22618 TaxID=1123014 RepID=A0A1Y6C7L3_9NEIS|nr:FCD domain-containing protein [Pseudogulbenkiania subflava]SMF49183.1 DNA-binding transcriptional regulator, GntR family [Pseudogulbenkiania subflava DSM 22618]